MKLTFAAAMFLIAMSGSPNPSVAGDAEHFRALKINDHLYAFIGLDPTIDLVDGNSYAIMTDDGVFVVDAHHLPIIAEANIAAIRRLTDKPVRYLLNTHWHGDHNTANFVYQREYPDVQIIAQTTTREILAKRMPEWIKSFREGEFEGYIAQYDSMVTTGKASDSQHLTPIERDRAQRVLDMLRKYNVDSRRVEAVLPNVSFDREMTLFMGGREIQIRFAGRANTPGDAFVWLPQDSILITGDIVVHPIPYCFGGFYQEWIAVLDTMIALKPKVILPGHGGPMYDTGYLETIRDLFSTLVDGVRDGLAAGVTDPDSLRQRIDVSRFRQQMTTGDANLEVTFDGFMLQPSIRRIKKELTGEIPTPDPAN